jgi:hypothetical protein
MSTIDRRSFLKTCAAIGALGLAGRTLAATEDSGALIGAAWRGPNPTDPYFAGVLHADWASKKISIRYAVPLPTRPHGILPEADGGLLVAGVRPGSWMLRCNGQGEVTARVDLDAGQSTRLNGHAIVAPAGDRLYTTETDFATGRGRIGVRQRDSLKKIAEWDSHGIEPHQALVDQNGHLVIANGGIPRTRADKKIDLDKMDASLVRLDGQSGKLLRQWKLDDPRLSLRHLAWSADRSGARHLGIAMQAEHDSAEQRAIAPILAVLDGDELYVPTRANDGVGYAGDIAAAYGGGFALSSNQVGVVQLWHPATPDKLTAIVELKEAYALADWPGPQASGGVLVSTALGLVRWHPSAKPLFLAWPQPMALDNHWTLIGPAA